MNRRVEKIEKGYKPVQAKIIKITEQYTRDALTVEEYNAFLKSKSKKNDFNEFNAGGYIERELLEYPETLFRLFKQFLEDEEMEYLNTKQGARWFGKTFPQFLSTKSV